MNVEISINDLRERNCGNCYSRQLLNPPKLKKPNISCGWNNKIMNEKDCCPLHKFLEEVYMKNRKMKKKEKE